MMDVAILAIGDEVVSGKTINTNAAYLAKALFKHNYFVVTHLACPDRIPDIMNALSFLYRSVDLVITIGGIGPTADDVTKEAVSRYFQEDLVLYPDILEAITAYFARRGQVMPPNNRKQAYFPQNAVIIPNENGTAPGMIYEKMGKTIIVLPGPERELIPMVETTVLPYLGKKQTGFYLKREFRFMNIGESRLMESLQPIIDCFPSLKMVSYVKESGIDFIVSTNNRDEASLLEEASEQIQRELAAYWVGDGSQEIQELVVQRLIEKGDTVAVSESLTGGLLASMIVDVPGSSAVFHEAVVTYSNEAKVKRLGVSEESLKQYGAVSEEVAREMALGILREAKATFGLSTTGIAGPTGATPNKPVGLVYIGIATKDRVNVYRYIFNGNRNVVRKKTCYTALFHLWKDFLEE